MAGLKTRAAIRPELRDAALRIAETASGPSRRAALAEHVPAPVIPFRGAPTTTFHELYRVDRHEIDVAWLDDGSLVGQVTADSGDPIADGVSILYGGDEPRQVALDATGEFELEGVGPGTYELAIETPDLLLVVPRLDLVRR